MDWGTTNAARGRSGVLAGVVLTLVVAVPTLVVAEDWHGRPLIDQSGLGWVVPAVVAALAFVAGGAAAGRRHRRIAPALGSGFAVGAVAVVVLLAADVVRRLLVNPTLPPGVVDYWIEAAIGSTALALVGAVVGYRFLRAGPRPASALPGRRA